MDRPAREEIRSLESEMKIRLLIRWAASLAAICTVAAAFAGPGATLLQRNVAMIASPDVALDLKLSAAQASQRDEILMAYQDARENIVSKIQGGDEDAGYKELGKAQEQLEVKLLSLLTPPQVNRLKQIGIQQEGIAALQDDAVAKDLALTAAQRVKIKLIEDATAKAQDDYQAALGEALAKLGDPGTDNDAIKAYTVKQAAVVKSMKPREKQFLTVKGAGDKQILALLTPVQRKKWTAMHGKPLNGTKS
jgi:hypothetical protein